MKRITTHITNKEEEENKIIIIIHKFNPLYNQTYKKKKRR